MAATSVRTYVAGVACSVLATAVLLVVFPVHAAAQQRCLVSAWDAFNKKEYPNAIKAADECIDEFGSRAAREQAELETKKEKPPQTGRVDNGPDRKQIFERWAVNDVSTAYFIKGRSAEHLSKNKDGAKYKQVASDAFTEAKKLTYGRCFDKDQNVFWSPAEVSGDRLPMK
jgi:hypothetical protein